MVTKWGHLVYRFINTYTNANVIARSGATKQSLTL